MSGRRRGTSDQEREETGRLIIDAARRLFMVHGYRAVSTRQVAEAVGLTQPALYHHFATKEELYVAVVLEEVGRLRAGIERVVRREAPSRERLTHLARFMLSSVDYDFPQLSRDMESELGAEARQQLAGAFVGGVVGQIAGVFAAGQGTGELRAQAAGGLEPMAAAWLFMALVAHFLDRPSGGEAVVRPGGGEAGAEVLVRVLLDGIAARDGQPG